MINFDSKRKRMTVIVKAPHGEIKVLSKGADCVMIPLLANTKENKKCLLKTIEHIRDYGASGLRSLMICERTVSQDFYRSWAYKYE